MVERLPPSGQQSPARGADREPRVEEVTRLAPGFRRQALAGVDVVDLDSVVVVGTVREQRVTGVRHPQRQGEDKGAGVVIAAVESADHTTRRHVDEDCLGAESLARDRVPAGGADDGSVEVVVEPDPGGCTVPSNPSTRPPAAQSTSASPRNVRLRMPVARSRTFAPCACRAEVECREDRLILPAPRAVPPAGGHGWRAASRS